MDYMSILVIQIIIKQWDKSQQSAQHIEQRAQLANRYPIIFPVASFKLNQECVFDIHGDDLQGNRIVWSQPSDDIIQFDRFQVSIRNKSLSYLSASLPQREIAYRTLGSIDNKVIQCKYDWRYSVDHGGFYFWLYEEIIVNTMYTDSFDENLFMGSQSKELIDLE
jgi:hypothetical protein